MQTSSVEGRRANTAAETAAELAAFDHGLRIYTDGGCDSNGVGGVLGASGWGAHALQVGLDGDCLTTIAVADLWGPVETVRTSRWWMGATRGTNNTGELCGIGQALLWLRDVERTGAAVALLYDSMYAANQAQGLDQCNDNHELVHRVQTLLAEVRASGREICFIHVKGHSADGGNDRADTLVQWGKEPAPYSRLSQSGGEGPGRHNSVCRDGTRAGEHAELLALRFARQCGDDFTPPGSTTTDGGDTTLPHDNASSVGDDGVPDQQRRPPTRTDFDAAWRGLAFFCPSAQAEPAGASPARMTCSPFILCDNIIVKIPPAHPVDIPASQADVCSKCAVV